MSRRRSGILFLFYCVDQIIATKNQSKNDTISLSLQPNTWPRLRNGREATPHPHRYSGL